VRFPQLSNDPIEQFLLEEAVLEPYALEKAARSAEERRWRDAHQEAREQLEARRAGGGAPREA
jgi:hypothetical protein